MHASSFSVIDPEAWPIMIDNICNVSDSGLAIMPGIDDLARERLALSILTLAASGLQGMALPSRPDRG